MVWWKNKMEPTSFRWADMDACTYAHTHRRAHACILSSHYPTEWKHRWKTVWAKQRMLLLHLYWLLFWWLALLRICMYMGSWTVSHGEVTPAELITGNRTLNQTAALEQNWAAWGTVTLFYSLENIDCFPDYAVISAASICMYVHVSYTHTSLNHMTA